MDEEHLPISPNPDQQCRPPRGQLNFSHRSTEFGSVKEKCNFDGSVRLLFQFTFISKT